MDERSRDIFFDALELPRDQRRRFLDEQTAGDPGLRADIESLIRANSDATDFLSGPPPAVPIEQETPAPEVHGFETLHPIGQGGFGAVFLARQEGPLDRPVAIKVLRTERLDDRSIQRFNAEQKILGSLCHPHIAAVHEAGRTEDGCPYTVMEWIDGSPITEWCDRHRAPLEQRLGLFLEVCDAIAFAHRRAVIHADLKPSNVLVRTEDGEPCTKVIDFGLARTLQQNQSAPEGAEADVMSDGTLHSLLGTPSYMSPEQAGPRGTLVDTRADIYGLGAMLYELLVGVPALEVPARSSLRDTLVAVQTTATVPPSFRFASFSPFGRSRRAQRCSVREARLRRRLEGDLDAIVERCLRKNPDDRYPTVEQLAEDVCRHLDRRPVRTRQMGWTHSVSRFAQRNVVGVSVALSLIAGTFVGLNSTLIQLDRARRAETGQVQAQDAARSWNEASERTAEFLSGLLIASSPRLRGRNLRVVDVLDLADEKLPEHFADKPIVLARLSAMLGTSFHHLGETEPALRNLIRAVSLFDELEDHENWRDAASELMLALGNSDRIDEALEWCDRLEVRAADDQDFRFCLQVARAELAIRANEFERALQLAEANLELARSADLESKRETQALESLAIALRVNGRNQQAVDLFPEAQLDPTLDVGSLRQQQLRPLRELARVLTSRGERQEAARLLERVVARQIELLGPNHLDVTNTRYQLSDLLMKLGRKPDAIGLIADARDAEIFRHGPTHPRAIGARTNHAIALFNSGDRSSARQALVSVRADAESGISDDAELLLIDAVLAASHPATRSAPEEIDQLRELVERFDRIDVPLAATRTRILTAIGQRFGEIGSFQDSAGVWCRLADEMFARNGASDPDWLRTRHSYAKNLMRNRDYDGAVRIATETRELVAEVRDLGTQHRRNAETSLIELFMFLKRHQDAIELKARLREEASDLITGGLPVERRIEIARWMLTRGALTRDDAEAIAAWAAELPGHPTEEIAISAMLEATFGDRMAALRTLDEAIERASAGSAPEPLDLDQLRRARRAILGQSSSERLGPSPRSRR